MFCKILIFLSFSCLGTSLYSQPTDYEGIWEFKIKDGRETIKFININKSDTIFVDTEIRYQLKIIQRGIKCFSTPATPGNKIQLIDGIILFFGIRQIPIIVVEITNMKNAEKMSVKFFNYKENSFSTEFKFKSGEYTVDAENLLDGRKAIRKEGYMFNFIKQRYFEKKSTNY